MTRRPRTPIDELYRRAVAYVDRRGGAAIRRGGRSGGGSWGKKGFDAGKLYGLSQFSAANWYQTQVGGGEAGVASGFGEVLMLRVRSLTAAYQYLRAHTSNGGYQVVLAPVASSDLLGYAWYNTTQFVSPNFKFPTARFGRVLLVWLQHTGTNVRLMLDRLDTVASLAITGYQAPDAAARDRIGLSPGGADPATGVDYLGHLTWRGVPSDTQLIALADQIRTLSDLPATFPLGTAGDADIAALAPRHWYRMDTFTPFGENLGTLTNRNLAVGGVLNVAAGTIALPAADAAINGQLSIALTGTQWLISSLPASEFRFLHNGAGFESFFIYTPTDVSTSQVQFATTRPGSLMDPGAQGTIVQVGTTLSTFRVGNGTATPPILTSDAPFALVNGTATYSNASYTETPSVGIEYFFCDRNVVARSGNSAAAPSTADPYRTLVVGAGAITFDGPLRGRVADILLFDRVLTEAERQKVRDYIRVRYGVGQVTTTHRWSLRDALYGQLVTNGQLAPASLPDTVTGAAIDRMDRQGSPVVRVIDASVDGRQSYGAQGFSTAAFLKTAGSSLPGIPAGFWRGVYFRLDALPAAASYLFAQSNHSNAGWQMWIGGSGAAYALTFRIVDGGGVFRNAATIAMSASDLGQPLLFVGVWDGAMLYAYVRRALIGAGGAVTGFTPSPNALTVGVAEPGGTSPLLTGAVLGWAGGDVAGGATQAEVFALFDAVAATGRMQSIPGKTDHYSDVSADIIANGGPANGIPAQVLDRIGTDHLTRVGTMETYSAPDSVRSINFVVASNYIASTASGGLRGAVAGFHVVFDYVLLTSAWAGFVTIGSCVTAPGANPGWGVQIGPSWARGYLNGGNTNAVAASAAGQRTRVLIQYDGANLLCYVNGAASSPLALAYSLPTGPMYIGFLGSSVGNNSCAGIATVELVQGGDGQTLSAGEITALFADRTQPPPIVVGKTLRRWRLEQDFAESGGKLPVIVKERISGTDHMAVIGAPLQVASRTERLWSYETQPLLYGTGSHTSANKYTASAGASGNATAFGGTLVWCPRATTTSATRVLLSALGLTPNRGYDIRTSGTNASISVFFINGTGANFPSGIASLTAAALGKICVYSWQWNAVDGKLHTFLNRVEVGTGAVIAGYTPGAGAACWGASLPGAESASDSALYGLVLWDGIAGLSQVQSQHDAIMANDGRVQGMPGVSNTMLIDPTEDARTNGGVLPATLADRIGANHFTRAGAPSTEPQYARAFGF